MGSFGATPYEVLIDERVEKDLEKVPKHVVEKFLSHGPRNGFLKASGRCSCICIFFCFADFSFSIQAQGV